MSDMCVKINGTWHRDWPNIDLESSKPIEIRANDNYTYSVFNKTKRVSPFLNYVTYHLKISADSPKFVEKCQSCGKISYSIYEFIDHGPEYICYQCLDDSKYARRSLWHIGEFIGYNMNMDIKNAQITQVAIDRRSPTIIYITTIIPKNVIYELCTQNNCAIYNTEYLSHRLCEEQKRKIIIDDIVFFIFIFNNANIWPKEINQIIVAKCLRYL